MLNSIYQLINLHGDQMGKAFKIRLEESKKEAQELKKKYYFITYEASDLSNLILEGVIHQLKSFHVTVFEDVRTDEAYGQASYHLTMALVNKETKESYTARAYFSVTDTLLYLNMTDSTGKILTMQNKDIHQFAFSCAGRFSQALQAAHVNANGAAEETYTKLITEIEKLSLNLTSNKKWKNYHKALKKLLAHFEHWQTFAFHAINAPAKYFIRLEASVAKTLKRLETQLVPSQLDSMQPEAVEEKLVPSGATTSVSQTTWIEEKLQVSQYETAKSELIKLEKSDLPTYRKLILEINLLDQLFLVSDQDDEFLSIALKVKKLKETAYTELMYMIILGRHSDALEEDLESLIKIIPIIRHKDLTLAIKNNRIKILTLLLKHHSYVNLNLKPEKGERLLQQAYDQKNLEIFKLLLQAGANCEADNLAGLTLLMNACVNGRKEEMVALLDAGSRPGVKNVAGFNALGCLTLISTTMQPDLALVKLFLEHSSSDVLNSWQGR